MQPNPPTPPPDYDDPKQIYAPFGLAFYKANALEMGVINLAVALMAQGNTGVTVEDIKKLYDSFETKTFGQVLHLAKQQYQFSDDFSKDLDQALKQRNYLAHAFFMEHHDDRVTNQGRRKMIDKLIEIWKQLAKVDTIMDGYWMSAWESHGITAEWVAEQMAKYAATLIENDA